MPSIDSRMSNNFDLSGYVDISRPDHSAGAIPNNVLSVEGYSPARGVVPPEFMNDTDIRKLYPSNPYLVRGFADVNTFIRNTALQALGKVQ